jgi:hypothetical protein
VDHAILDGPKHPAQTTNWFQQRRHGAQASVFVGCVPGLDEFMVVLTGMLQGAESALQTSTHLLFS